MNIILEASRSIKDAHLFDMVAAYTSYFSRKFHCLCFQYTFEIRALLKNSSATTLVRATSYCPWILQGPI